MYRFCVITAIGDDPTGNTAVSTNLKIKTTGGYRNPIGNEIFQLTLGIGSPVFTLGEVLILCGDREACGKGRKPLKWEVDYELFDDVEQAVAKSIEVLAANQG